MDDLRSMLRFRNLDKGFAQNPLREFTGTLADIEVKTNERFGGTDAVFKFTDITVLKSVTPYEFSITDLPFRFRNDKGRTDERGRYGIYAGSIAQFIPSDVPEGSEWSWLIGKRLHSKQVAGHLLYDKQANQGKGGETPQDAWECVGIVGATAGSNGAAAVPQNPIEVAIRLMHDKTEQQFNMAALRDPVIKQHQKVVQAILTKALLPNLLGLGIVTKGDDGKFSVAGDDDTIKAAAEAMLQAL